MHLVLSNYDIKHNVDYTTKVTINNWELTNRLFSLFLLGKS